MGRSFTPKYKLIMDNQVMCWHGKATQKALVEYVHAYAKSLELGGCNDHISKALGYIPYPYDARIEYNDEYVHKNDPVAVWKAAPFQIW